MAEVTGIAWTDHTLLRRRTEIVAAVGMVKPMTGLAERNPVSGIVSAFGMRCPWQDMMSIQISAFVVSAVRTRKTISRKHVKAPTLRGNARAVALAFDALPIFIVGAFKATFSYQANLATDPLSDFCGVLRTYSMGVQSSFSCLMQRMNSLWRMLLALKGRSATLGANTHLHSPASNACACHLIRARAIFAERINGKPVFAFCAAFLSVRKAAFVFINRKTGPLRGSLDGTFGSLRHG